MTQQSAADVTVEQDWLTFVGGSELVRDAIRHKFAGSEVGSVESLAHEANASLTVVFCDDEIDFDGLANLTSDAGRYVIAVSSDVDIALFNQLLGHGVTGVTTERASVHQLVDVARAALRGDVLLPAVVVRSMLSGESRPAGPSDLGPVTTAVLNELAAGKSIKEIADALNYSERTVQRRIRNLCVILGAITPTQAVHLAHQRGIL